MSPHVRPIQSGYLVLESGAVFEGVWHGGAESVGEAVFNTSHCGYEEIATDPSYYGQIMVMTAPMQGNYGSHQQDWESERVWIRGFVCLSIQQRGIGRSWLEMLLAQGVPVLSEVDTRELTLLLRASGTQWAALLSAPNRSQAIERARELIRTKREPDSDWTQVVTTSHRKLVQGQNSQGPRVALLDFGAKKNIIHNLQMTCSEIGVFPSTASASEIQEWNPDGILLSNGPGDPSQVGEGVETTRKLLGWRPIFGICMGHQVLSLALGAKTYKLKFGHRGGNHPVQDHILGRICVTSHNHGYSVDGNTLDSNVKVTHVNLNDKTVEGIECASKKCFSVQFHPESAPGPHEAHVLFKLFMDKLR